MEFSRRTEVGRRNRLLVKVVVGLVAVGAVIGGFFGMVGATVLDAAGIRATEAPPTAAASASATPSATPSATASAPPTTEVPPPPDPTPQVDADPAEVSPGERINLSGIFPDLDGGTSLQVERREEGGEWTEFPVNARTQDDGTFSTWVQTSRPGTQEFRLVADGGTATPPVEVTIG